MECTEINYEIEDRKKASCCDWSAPVTIYRYLLESSRRSCFVFLVVFQVMYGDHLCQTA